MGAINLDFMLTSITIDSLEISHLLSVDDTLIMGDAD